MSAEKTVSALHREIEEVFVLLDRWCGHAPAELAMVPKDVGWTVQSILEHVGIVNHFMMLTLRKGVATALRRVATGRPVPEGESDLAIFADISDPDAFDWQPPSHMVPTGELSISDIRAILMRQQCEAGQILERMANGEGLLHTVRMSVRDLGRLDMYQWLWFMLMHARRHLVQIERALRGKPDQRERPLLRLIRSRRDGVRIGTVQLSVASAKEAAAVDAVVLEEDTWLVLSAEPEVTVPSDHPIRLFSELHEAQPLVPGTVIVHRERPLTLLAVVYDFGAEPCCRAEWVRAALAGIVRICRERGLRSVTLPLFGVRHGRMRPEVTVHLVIRAICEETPGLPVAVRLHVPAGSEDDVWQLLISASSGNNPDVR